MKIIDLLNKIANGEEIPKYIKYYDRLHQKEGIVNSNLRIRKLTPKECFRLMGVKDEDYEKCAKNQSDSSLYHLAGDSIVTNCLCAIFKQLIDN